jgi:uncharacterized integral membrane protein (TIGR00697 family)
MLLITVYGGVMVEVFGYSTNVGALCYASVLVAQFLLMEKHGWAKGANAALTIFGALMMFFLFTIGLSAMLGGSPLDTAYSLVIKNSHSFATASFVAFWLGQGVFVAVYKLLENKSVLCRYAIPMICAQIADTVVFFPIAFSMHPNMLEIAITGCFFKIAISLLVIPFLPEKRMVNNDLETD